MPSFQPSLASIIVLHMVDASGFWLHLLSVSLRMLQGVEDKFSISNIKDQIS